MPTETFPANLTCRFPRCLNIRYDKSWTDALTHDELIKIYDSSKKNLNLKRKVEDLNDNEMEIDLKKSRKVDKYTKLLDNFRDTDTNNVFKVSDLFRGLEFLVLTVNEEMSKNSEEKKQLEKLIVEHGGKKVQNLLDSTTHVIASLIDIRAKSILKKTNKNILQPNWVYDSIKYKKIMDLSPIYLLYTNNDTITSFKYTMDKYNDHYFIQSNPGYLEEIMKNMKVPKNSPKIEEIVDFFSSKYKKDKEFFQSFLSK